VRIVGARQRQEAEVFEETVRKLVMETTLDDVRAAIDSGAGKQMKDVVWAMSSLAAKWWQADGANNPKVMKEIQQRLAELQLVFQKRQ
jgi:hypothetical protein